MLLDQETWMRIRDSKLREIRNVNRWNGERLVFEESVPSHCHDMSIISILIADSVSPFQKLDIKDLVYRCTIHDLDEAILCDIPRKLKYLNDEVTNSVNKAVNDLLRSEVSETIFNDINNAKDWVSAESIVVSCLDLIQARFKMKDEIYGFGNKPLSSKLRESNDYAKVKISMLKESDLLCDELRTLLIELIIGGDDI